MLENYMVKNKIFVITGTLEHYTRDQAKKKITERGGKFSRTVTKNTDFLVKGYYEACTGVYYEKCKKLDKVRKLAQEGVEVKVIDEAEFWDLIHGKS